MIHKSKKEKNKGFTLIEIVASITILGIVMVSLLTYFTTAIKANILARKSQQVTIFAQSVMEKTKDIKSDEIDTLYPAELDGAVDRTDGKYIYKFHDVKTDSYTVDLKVTVDPKTNYETINNEAMVSLEGIVYPESIAVTETIQEEIALNYFITQNEIKSDASPSSYREPEVIKKAMHKVMYIDLKKYGASEDIVTLKVYYKYYCVGIPGVDNNTEATAKDFNKNLYSKNIEIKKLRKLYVFYNEPTADDKKTQIYINWGTDLKRIIESRTDDATGDPVNFELYLISQGPTDLSTMQLFLNQTPSGSTLDSSRFYLYSNVNRITAPAGFQEIDNLVSSDAYDKIANIKVEVFDNDKSYSDSKRITKLESTKGE